MNDNHGHLDVGNLFDRYGLNGGSNNAGSETGAKTDGNSSALGNSEDNNSPAKENETPEPNPETLTPGSQGEGSQASVETPTPESNEGENSSGEDSTETSPSDTQGDTKDDTEPGTDPEPEPASDGVQNQEPHHKQKTSAVLKIRFSLEELEKIETRAKAHGVSKYAYIRERSLDPDESDILPYKEQVDEVRKKVGFLEGKLPIFEKLYQTTGKYVDKINLAFADLLKNVSYFEERKDKILQQTKDFKVYIALKDEDKNSLRKEMGDMLEGYKCEVAEVTEQGGKILDAKHLSFETMLTDREQKLIKTIDEQMKKIQDANNNIIQKVEVNASFIDNINRIKREYLLAFFAFLISGTILMTIIVTYLLQMK